MSVISLVMMSGLVSMQSKLSQQAFAEEFEGAQSPGYELEHSVAHGQEEQELPCLYTGLLLLPVRHRV